jgi:DNA-3-methyladenine glycosylase II
MSKQAKTHLVKADPVLGSLILSTRLVNSSPPPNSHFMYLVETIISQQLSLKAAATIFQRFLFLFGNKKIPQPTDILKLQKERLRQVGISQAKVTYIRDLAQHLVSKKLNFTNLEKLGDEQIIMELTRIKGVGRWTAEMFLMFYLERPDVFSAGDLGLRNAIIKLYKFKTPPTQKQLEKITVKWRPYRTMACKYLWQSLS